MLEQRKKLRRSNNNETIEDYQQKILEVEDKIRKITNWEDAHYIWDRFQQVANSDDSTSTQAMWKWKKKLFPKIKPTPPLGIKDKEGQVKIQSCEIKSLYEEEYKHRLRSRTQRAARYKTYPRKAISEALRKGKQDNNSSLDYGGAG